MRTRLLAFVAGFALLGMGPAVADDAGLTITPDALASLDNAELSVQAAGAADEVAPASFVMPVTNVTFNRGGGVKAIRMAGGLTIAGQPVSLDLTNLRVNLRAQQASVVASSPGTRIPAFDVVKKNVTKKKVRGILLIAPGTASVLTEQFDTYVFSDGMRFARFVYPR